MDVELGNGTKRIAYLVSTSGISKTAAAIPEVHVSQLVEMTAENINVCAICFQGRASQGS